MASLTTKDFSCDEQTIEYFLTQAADGGDPIGSAATPYFRCGEHQAVNVTRDILGANAAL